MKQHPPPLAHDQALTVAATVARTLFSYQSIRPPSTSREAAAHALLSSSLEQQNYVTIFMESTTSGNISADVDTPENDDASPSKTRGKAIIK